VLDIHEKCAWREVKTFTDKPLMEHPQEGSFSENHNTKTLKKEGHYEQA
jgi:hypothetical protein